MTISAIQNKNLDLMAQWAIDNNKIGLIQSDLLAAMEEFTCWLGSKISNEKLKQVSCGIIYNKLK